MRWLFMQKPILATVAPFGNLTPEMRCHYIGFSISYTFVKIHRFIIRKLHFNSKIKKKRLLLNSSILEDNSQFCNPLTSLCEYSYKKYFWIKMLGNCFCLTFVLRNFYGNLNVCSDIVEVDIRYLGTGERILSEHINLFIITLHHCRIAFPFIG